MGLASRMDEGQRRLGPVIAEAAAEEVVDGIAAAEVAEAEVSPSLVDP